MKTRNAIRMGVLMLVALALAAVWAAVAAADGQPVTLTVSPSGTFDKVGVSTVGGQLSCNYLMTLQLSGQLQEAVGRTKSVHGNINSTVSCGPGAPVGWSAQAIPYDGKFAGGDALLQLNYSGSFIVPEGYYPPPYPPYPSCYLYWNGQYYYQCYVQGITGPQTVHLDKGS